MDEVDFYNLDIKKVGDLKPEDLEHLIESIEKGLFYDTWYLRQEFQGVEK